MSKRIIEGYGCELISVNSRINFSMEQVSRSPTYNLYPNSPNNLVIDFTEGIKVVIDKGSNVKQINFDTNSGYTFHDKIIPGKTKLSNIKEHHWSFDHMHPGLITSEFYKGVGFAINSNIENYFEHLLEGTSIERLIVLDDFAIGDIVVFSNVIDGKHPFDMYEAFIWNDSISTMRRK